MNVRSARGIANWCAFALLVAACAAPPVEPPPDPDPKPGRQEPVTPTSTSTDSQILVLPNGIATYVTSTPNGTGVQIQLGILAGALFEAPALARLSAEVLLKSVDPSRNQRSLQQNIEAMGGTIDLQIGLMTTWFDIRVPGNRLVNALTDLRTALESVTQSRNQIARIRDELATRATERMLADPIDAMSRATLLAEPSTSEFIRGLLDIDPSQVRLFHSRLYRPENCQLLISRGNPAAKTIKALQNSADKALPGWVAQPAIPGDISLLTRKFQSKLYWSNHGSNRERNEVAIVLPLPQLNHPFAAELLVLHSCLTLDGTGGRFERMQDEAGLGHLEWRSRYLQAPDSHALVLTTTATPTEANKLWFVLENARRSLVDVPPSPSETKLGLRHAQLNAGLAQLSNHARLRLTAGLAMTGLPANVVEAKLAQLETKPLDYSQIAPIYIDNPAWMIVFGAGRPDAQDALVAFDLLPAGYASTDTNTNAAEPAASNDPWLDRAKAAFGRPSDLGKVIGLDATATLTPVLAPTVEDVISWRDDGTLNRQRTMLGEVITTKLAGNSWSESHDTTTKSLTAEEASELRHEMQRHPLMLLAAEASGKLSFRPIAQRDDGDRSLMVMEAVSDEFDHLRIHIDTESHLIRVVESWERIGETIVHVRETWSDYRNVGAMRLPHRRDASWNDGEHRSRTTYTSCTPATK